MLVISLGNACCIVIEEAVIEGYNVSLEPVIEEASIVLGQSCKAAANSIVPDAVVLHDAAYFFSIFKRLFADLILSFQDIESSRSFFQHEHMTWEKAFKVIEFELGFMYDLLYTKASVIHTYLGSFLRTISLSLTVFTLLAFFLIDKPSYSRIDKSITCVLLVAAIALQVYEMLILFSSDLTLLWLSKHKNLLVDPIYKTTCCLQSWLQSCHMMPAVSKRFKSGIAIWLSSFTPKLMKSRRPELGKTLTHFNNWGLIPWQNSV
ncbi:hypothetical protein JCGZ_20883 [Jatropha curcas]|uniref:DUF4220 domain-containing protein n=1 Tax=Jatropha curcas TaxID=180498 RepID=A0A067L9G5_JATCU|nr:hypothetical protein JCGZ_20883 [Jatropha curcas]